MREIMKRTVAAVMAVLIACAAAGCSSTGNSSSGSSSAGETTTTTAPVVEDMGNIDLSDVTTEYDVPEDFSYESEAEKGTLSGGAAVLDKNFLGKFSGDGFVSIGSSGDMVEFEIDFPAKGSYNITLTMAADGEGQSNLITVDGAALTNFTSTTTEFGDTMAENVLIDEGTHKVGIKGDNGHIYIDKIKITPAPAIDLSQYEVSNQLSNPNASDEAKRLYNFLTDVYGKYTISGQSSGDNEGKDSREFKEIKKHTRVDVKMMGKSLLLPEQAHLPVVAGRLNGGGGRIVVKHKGRLVPVPYLLASHLPEGIDGLEIQVVNLRKINVGRYDFPADHPVTAAVLCQYLLYRMHILFSCPAFFSCPAYMILNLSNTL